MHGNEGGLVKAGKEGGEVGGGEESHGRGHKDRRHKGLGTQTEQRGVRHVEGRDSG
jgi:hypothetical protein